MKKFLSFLISLVIIIAITPTQCIASTQIVYDSFDKAVCAVRDAMVRRQENITVSFEGSYYDTVVDELMNEAMSEERAVNSSCGDYIRYSYSGWQGEVTYTSSVVTIDYDVQYYTTAAKESVVSEYVRDTLDGIEGNDYEIVKYFYDTIASSVVYDYTSKPISHTAYAAVNGKAVCQGYALLFYKLCKEWGINCRIVGGNEHCWNIVELKGIWYNADVCWDAALHNKKEYGAYFLKCDSEFPNHTLDENSLDIESKLNMASVSYVEHEVTTEPETTISETATTELTTIEKQQNGASETVTAISADDSMVSVVELSDFNSDKLVVTGVVCLAVLCIITLWRRAVIKDAIILDLSKDL